MSAGPSHVCGPKELLDYGLLLGRSPKDLKGLLEGAKLSQRELRPVSFISSVAFISNDDTLNSPRRTLMTIPATAQGLGGRLPSSQERAAANQLRTILAAQAAGETKLRVLDDGKPAEITLTPALSDLLMELLRHVGKGDAVTLVPVSQMLTTQQAAEILNVSRPFLISLLERGDIDYSMVGRHRRIKADTLFEYKVRRDGKRAKALDELGELDGELL